jgi:hypothetical protein
VIQGGFDHYAAAHGHPGRNRSPNVVQVPFRDARAPVEVGLRQRSSRESVAALAKQLVAAHHARHAFDDLAHHRHQRQHVRAAVLTARRWNRESPAVEINLRPAHVAELGASAAGEDQ